jgi:hypothetical protein
VVKEAKKEAPKKKRGRKRKARTPTPQSTEGEEESSENELCGFWDCKLVNQLVLDFSVIQIKKSFRDPYSLATPTMTLGYN